LEKHFGLAENLELTQRNNIDFNMKKILLTSLLFYSNLLFSDQVFKTDIPDILVKNFICHDVTDWVGFNLVNRSDKHVWGITLSIIDKEGDILDVKSASYTSVPPKSGSEVQITNVNCNTLRKNKVAFSIKLGN
jgi:hypothetical protein